MRVLMLLAKDMESRSIRACEALIDSGHDVQVLCRRDKSHSNDARYPACEVKPVGHRLLSRQSNHLLTKPIPGNPVYAAAITKALLSFRPDVIHVHDLPLVVTAAACSMGKIPIIFDLHENYPAMVDTWKDRSLTHRLLIRAGLYHHWEELALRCADEMLVVCDEQRDRLVDLGVPAHKITVVGNTPDLSEWNKHADPPHDVPEDAPVALYTGILASTRGLDPVLDMWPQLLQQFPAARLVIAGEGEEGARLRRKAQSGEARDNIVFTGWLDRDGLRSWTARANACIIPHTPSPFTDTTYPNKLFEFMAFEKPVIVSPARPMVRLVNEPGDGPAGLVADTTEQWLNAVTQIFSDREQAQAMGVRGAEMVHSHYNAACDQERLLGIYERIESGQGALL